MLPADNLSTAQHSSGVGLHRAAIDMPYTSHPAPYSKQTSSPEDNLYDTSLSDLDGLHDGVQSRVHHKHGETPLLASGWSQASSDNAQLGPDALLLLRNTKGYV